MPAARERSVDVAAARKLPQPLVDPTFPEALPVSARRAEIARAIHDHPVVIVCGETGSGKTTQLPKICALAGRGRRGLIGHTQPRRLAATTVAQRIAEELGTPPGVLVGYKIRFNEKLSPTAVIKLMTDGILLAETLSDPLLRAYDTVIVDEAHERSLNSDFLLGYLKQLLAGPRRDDLKVVITSATIDAERFAAHFGEAGRPAPVIEVSGRLYPVEIRHQGFDEEQRDDDDETDLPSRIDEAIETLWRDAPGDVLVFLPGEREIRDVADHLRRRHARETAARTHSPWARGAVEILPLYSRLSAADQHRVFGPSKGRRVVLATNVAETSLTVPGIRYVVDSGLARVKRYRYRSKVEQLQIEPISQAAANQRAGRCGRVADGICIRLYDQADFAKRPRFTDPEVLRSSLAAVILRMKALRLADVEAFPFLDPPPRKAVVDGYALLRELGALDEDHALTEVGRQLSRLPVDPRLGRMLLAAHERGCLREVLVIAAALSGQDARERPLEAQQAADQSHRRFADESSDFLGILKLWTYWTDAQAAGESNRKLAGRLEREFLSPRRLREWSDLHRQLSEAVTQMHWRINDAAAPPEAIHQALLAGLLGNLGFKPLDEPQYAGTHGIKFAIHPGSSVGRKAPRWLMAAELVDTGRLYARNVARIDPAWIERAAGHLIVRSWSDPAWSKNAGQVVAFERGTLYGLTIYAQRRVEYGSHDPVLAREILIREALVGGDWDSQAPFVAHNRKLIAEIQKLEHKIRRPDLLVDEAFLFDWFDARIPSDVTSGHALEQWVRKARGNDPTLLFLSRDELLKKDSAGVTSDAFPRQVTMRGMAFALDYHFDPGAPDDGVTMQVPLYALNQVDAARTDWLVPGMLRDKVAALVKSLPQKLRRGIVPVPQYAEEFCERWATRVGERTLVDALIEDLREHRSARVAAADFRLETLPVHMTMNYKVVDEHGGYVAAGRSLPQLRAELGPRTHNAFQAALAGFSARPGPGGGGARADVIAGNRDATIADTAMPEDGRDHRVVDDREDARAAATAMQAGRRFRDWSFGPLPELMELADPSAKRGGTLIGYPALVDRGEDVELCVFDEPASAAREHRRGLRRLFAIALKDPLKYFEKNLPDAQRLGVGYAPFGGIEDLRDDLRAALLDRACLGEPLPVGADDFAARVEQARGRLNLIGQELARTLGEVLAEHGGAQRKLASARGFAAACADIESQLAALLPKRFISSTPADAWRHLPRYLKAVSMRIDKLRADPARDARLVAEMAPILSAYRRMVGERRGEADPRLEELRWLLEELRVSLFAQELRTPTPVSVKRLRKVIDALRP